MDKKIKLGTLIICFLLSIHYLFGNNQGRWVEFNLGRELPAFGVQYSAGGNCLIWLDTDSGRVCTFETYTHNWHAFEGHILPQSGDQVSSAGEDVALVWDDTTALAFNAREQKFHELQYQGYLTDALYGQGCYSSTAWFLTSEKLYIFDAHDDAWKSFNYTKPDGSSDYTVWRCRDKPDYLFLELRSSTDYNLHTLITYSRITHTFNELMVNEDLLHTIMDKGFVFYYDDISAEDHDYFGGYSAVTAEFTLFQPNLPLEKFTVGYPENFSGHTVLSFFYKSEIAHPEYKGHFCVYNTATGNIDSTSFDYMYAGDGLNIITKINGADFSVISTYQKGGDETINYLVYSGISGTFFSFSTELIYDYDYAGLSTGSGLLTQNDHQFFLCLDIATQTSETSPMPDPPDTYHHLMHPFTSHQWGINCCDIYTKDTVNVYSYNSITGTMQTFRSRSTGSFVQLNNENISAYIPHFDSGSPFIHIYTPGTDTWHEIPVNSSVSWTYNRDFITLFMEGEENVILYDGISGANHRLPFGHSDYSYNYRYIYDNFLILYTNQGGSEAYSTFTRSTASHPTSGNWHGQVAVAICNQSETTLAYNALYNCFSVLETDAETHGQYRGYTVGDSIAAVFFSEGYLFAYDPYADSTTVDISNEISGMQVPRFRLDQNFPNPFNSVTTIHYTVGRHSSISDLSYTPKINLSVYNILGQKIETLVNKKQQAGSYMVQLKADALPSGVYIYRLSTDTGIKMSGKMIILR